MKQRLVVTRAMPPRVVERVRAEFDSPAPGDRELSDTEVMAMAADADALMISSNLKLTADRIAALPERIKIVATCSVGFEHIDVAAARARRLQVTNTPDVLTDCTADLTMLLILAACRRAAEYAAITRAGWGKPMGPGEMLGLRVSGRTLGILGMGRIGQAVARRARGFGMRIVYCNRHRLPADLEAGATYFADFNEMLPHCQVLSLNAASGPGTVGVMNAAAFQRLPDNAVFVNASRGALVDEEALIAALRSGKLFAAGLDVFAAEPSIDPRLAAMENVFLTPHMGSATVETRDEMGFRALDNISAVLAGKPAIDPLWT